MLIHIRPILKTDQERVTSLLEKHYGSGTIVSRGEAIDMASLPGFLAYENDKLVGIITLHSRTRPCSWERDKDRNSAIEWEVVSLNAFVPRKGVGGALLRHAESFAKTQGAMNLWLITTNDNIDALAFYQKRGFRLVAVHRDAVIHARKLKPQIPLVADNGIPITDEIELERILVD